LSDAIKQVEAEKKKREKTRPELGFDFGSLLQAGSSPQFPKVLMVGGIGAIAVLAVVLIMNAPASDPLIERSVYVAKAVADNDNVRVKAVATPETGDDAVLWMQTARASQGITGTSGDYMISASLLNGGGKMSSADVIVSLATQAPAAPNTVLTPDAVQDPRAQRFVSTTGSPQTISLQISFVKDSQGEWRLEGHTSLQAIQSTKSAHPKGNAQGN
jgi:hypothetical protein